MTLTARLAAYFAERPNQWIDGRELATIAGAYAWRSRVSDVRRIGMTIENRQRRLWHVGVDPTLPANGSHRFVISEYRYVTQQAPR